MKYFKQTLWIASLLLLLLPGCSNEERLDQDTAGNVCLTLTVPGAAEAETKANPDPGESKITNVYLLFYKQGAPTTALPTFFFSKTGLDNDTEWSRNFTIADLSVLEANATYDVYALASLPTTAVAPTSSTSLNTLRTLNEKQFVRTPSEPAISFAGTSTYIGGSETSIDIELTRTVARIDITLTGMNVGQTASIIIDDQALYTPFLGGGTQTNPSELTSSVAFGQDKTFRGYIYENGTGNTKKAALFISILNADGSSPISYLGVINKGQITRNTIYTVNAKLMEGFITITTTTNMPWIDGSDIQVTPDSQYPEDVTQPEANSYMMKAGSKPIYIPVSQIKAANAYNSNITAITDTDELTTELLWTDVKDSDTGKGIGSKAPVQSIRVLGKGNNALIQVIPGTASGNSVIVVKDATGKIRWSWHIWVIDPTVPLEEKTYTNGGITYTLMDRHLGATSITPGNLNTYGLAYQWGRKDPFPQAGATTAGYTTPRVFYDAAGKALAEAKGYQIQTFTIAMSINNPWRMNTSTEGYWASDRNNTMWGNGKAKTVYDPCPAGWRVPEQNALAGVTGMTANGTLGATHLQLGFFPLAGIRWWDDLRVYEAGASGYMYASDNSDGNNNCSQYKLTTNSIAMTKNAYYPNGEFAISVRCLKIVTP